MQSESLKKAPRVFSPSTTSCAQQAAARPAEVTVKLTSFGHGFRRSALRRWEPDSCLVGARLSDLSRREGSVSVNSGHSGGRSLAKQGSCGCDRELLSPKPHILLHLPSDLKQWLTLTKIKQF